MEVSSQLHAPAALPPGRKSLVQTGWAREPVWMLRRREKSLVLAGNRTLAVQSVAQSLYRLRLIQPKFYIFCGMKWGSKCAQKLLELQELHGGPRLRGHSLSSLFLALGICHVFSSHAGSVGTCAG
jgi:hypothetical protein